MSQYRKKPVEISAWPVKDLIKSAQQHWPSLPDCIKEEYENGNIIFCPEYISISTLEGWMKGNIEDMLIKGVKGELYPCKPDIFEATYDTVEATQ